MKIKAITLTESKLRKLISKIVVDSDEEELAEIASSVLKTSLDVDTETWNFVIYNPTDDVIDHLIDSKEWIIARFDHEIL